jgi:cohesin complex subunit SA-1/2
MMKDWECMTDLLIEEPGPMEEGLDDRQETSLIEIMVCCIRQSATGEPPVGRGPTRRVLSARELKQVADDKTNLTSHFITTLPQLLHKYLPDPEKMANLLVIPQYFDMEIYTTSRQEKALDSLLKLLHEVVDKHSDKDVLETTAVTLEKLCDDQQHIYNRCDIGRSKLLDMVTNRYKEALDEYTNLLTGNETPDEDETFALVSSLKKVSTFYNCHDMSQLDIWDGLFKSLVEARDAVGEGQQLPLPEEAVKHCMLACYFGLLWYRTRAEENLDRDTTAAAIEELKERINNFMLVGKDMMSVGQSNVLKEEAFISVSDLLIVFSHMGDAKAPLQALQYRPDSQLAELLDQFIQGHVFVEDEDEEIDDHQKIEELHKRRNFLACYCKLVVYNVLPTKTAANVLKHYVTFYNDYGDIIKATLGKARENNKLNCAKTMIQALIFKFTELQQTGGKVDRGSEEFHAIKELAKRFALSFGLDALKNREAVTGLHREGILTAVNPLENPGDPTGPPPNLPFLELLTEFTNKLLKQDKKVVLTYLDKRIAGGMPNSRGEDWQPLLMYRNSLVHGEGEVPTTTSRKPYTRKKKVYGSDDEDDDDADDDDPDWR